MLAVLAIFLNVETIPIDVDRALAQYALVRSQFPRGHLVYTSPQEGYIVENGQLRRLAETPIPEHFKRMWEADHDRLFPKEWE